MARGLPFDFMGSVRFVLLSSCAFAWGGCAHADSAADRQLSEMREQMSHMQLDNDRFDKRLGELEVSVADDKALPRVARIEPRVVQLGAAGDRLDSDDPNDVTARPEIKVAGRGGGEARGPRGKAERNVHSSSLDPEAKKAYETGLALVNSKQYDRALDALAAFLVKYPDHPYVENATYWRGEAYFAKGEYARATEQFEAVLARPESGNKAPDALLKLGITSEKIGASDKANEFWARLRNDFPKSDAARRIPTSGTGTKGPKESR